LKALSQAGITQASRLWHCDEMRFGLWGQVRRRWGRKGVKIIQRVQIVFQWSYLVLAVDVVRGELRWAWSQRMNQQQLVPIFQAWPMTGVVWDGAPSHRGKLMGEVGFKRIFLPAYSPELNPAERVFEEVRRHIEGKVYPSVQAKKAAIEHLLRQLRSDKNRLRRLVSWDWIQQTMAQLPNA
jgi:DDE superfamily endonuclease